MAVDPTLTGSYLELAVLMQFESMTTIQQMWV